MSKKQKNETSAKAPVKLTRAEKKEIQAVIRKYKGDGKPHSAQVSIPYEAMYQDGVCRVTPRTFSKCIEFTDISYQLAQADTKTAIFENLCDLYNYLDASIHVQFSFINRKIDPKQYAKSFEIRAQGDDFDDIRSEYSDILQDQLVNGNNGLMKRKFMTYTIEADSLKMARARLRRIETDLLGYFKSMGASAWGLDAKERLEVMHSIFHPDGEPFSFDWKWLAPSGLSTKDFIAPSSFRFGNARMFGLGGKYGAVTADYKNVLVAGIFWLLRAAVHGEPFCLREGDIVFKYRVCVRLYVLGCPPTGRAVFHAFPVLLRVLALDIDNQPDNDRPRNA